VDIGRHRRRADQRSHALALAARATCLPAGASVPLWREACQVWSKLLAEVSDDAASQTARLEAQDKFSSAVLSQVQELNEQAKSQPADAAVLLLRQSDQLLAELLAEIPERLPARTAREELQRLIPARLLQASESLLGQATHATPEESLRLLKQAEALLKKLGVEFPECAPAKEVQARAAAQLRAAFLHHVSSRPPGEALTAFREMLAQFPGDAEAMEGLEQELCALRWRGAELARRGQFAEAIAHLEEAMSKSPGDGELLALKVRATEDREKFQALEAASAIHEQKRHGLAVLGLVDQMLALCPDSESLAVRRKQAAQVVEEAQQQSEEGKRLLQRGRFLKAHRAFEAAIKTCADDLQAKEGLGRAVTGFIATTIVGIGLTIALAWWSVPQLLDRVAWAETQAAVKAAGTDYAKVEELYQAYLKNSSGTHNTAKVANEKLAETQRLITKLEAKLATEKRLVWTGTAMRRAGFQGDQIESVLSQGGSVVAWGDSSYGGTAVPVGLSGVVAIAAGDGHSLALRQDGTVVGWGQNSDYQIAVPSSLRGVVAIAAGYYHTVALRQDGSVVAWGYNRNGQTSVPADLSEVVAIAAGGFHTVALRQDGSVVAWGKNSDGQIAVPAGLSGVVAIAVGHSHNLALRQDGTVVAWGESRDGKTSVPAGLGGLVAIAAGGTHNLALRQNGTVVAWGDNLLGQTTVPAGLSGVVAIAAGGTHSMALRLDGTVVAWGGSRSGETAIPTGLSAVMAITAGRTHIVALTHKLSATVSRH
jgi:tetratricopeptide (TPR) repeat protein